MKERRNMAGPIGKPLNVADVAIILLLCSTRLAWSIHTCRIAPDEMVRRVRCTWQEVVSRYPP